MPSAASIPEQSKPKTPLAAKLLDMYASPGDVLEEIVSTPPKPANWLVPMLLVCACGLFLLNTSVRKQQAADAIQQMIAAGLMPSTQAAKAPDVWIAVSALTTCLGTFAGTFWSAFVLWLIGRFFLKTSFSFLKTVEVVSLAGVVLALGTVFSMLLAWNFSESSMRPFMFLISDESDFRAPSEMALNTINIFHVWTTALLALGLSKLSRVSFKEAAFWVFGYWIMIRLIFILLAPPAVAAN